MSTPLRSSGGRPSSVDRNRTDDPGAAGAETRWRSRGWKRRARRPPASFDVARPPSTGRPAPTAPVGGAAGPGRSRPCRARAAWRGGTVRPSGAEVRLHGSQAVPVGGRLGVEGAERLRPQADGCSGLAEQGAQLRLDLVVPVLAEAVATDPPSGVDEEERRPDRVAERAPHLEVRIDGDRPGDVAARTARRTSSTRCSEANSGESTPTTADLPASALTQPRTSGSDLRLLMDAELQKCTRTTRPLSSSPDNGAESTQSVAPWNEELSTANRPSQSSSGPRSSARCGTGSRACPSRRAPARRSS